MVRSGGCIECFQSWIWTTQFSERHRAGNCGSQAGVGHILTSKFGTEIVPEEVSMGDSSSNGLAEHAVREVKAKARSLAHGLKRLLGQELESTHSVVTWLIQWADPVDAASLSLVKGSCGFQQESIKVTSMRGTCRECFWHSIAQ